MSENPSRVQGCVCWEGRVGGEGLASVALGGFGGASVGSPPASGCTRSDHWSVPSGCHGVRLQAAPLPAPPSLCLLATSLWPPLPPGSSL